MPKAARIGLFVLGGLIVLAIVGTLIAVITVDPAKLASTISKRVLRDMGRELHIEGDVSVSFFPWLGVTMADARLTNPEGFGGGDFFTVKHMQFRAKLLPLLQNKFLVDTVVLDGLVLNLVYDEQGLGNWQFMQRVPAREDPQAGAPPAETTDSAAPPAFLEIAAVEVSDATISYVNLATNSSVTTDNVKLSLSEIRQQDSTLGTNLSLSGSVHSDAPGMDGGYDLQSAIVFDQGKQKVLLRGFEFAFQGQGDAFPGSSTDVSLKADISIDSATQAAVIDNASFTAYGATVNGNLRIMAPGQNGGLAGNFALKECNPRTVLAALGASLPEMQDPNAFTRLSARLRMESSFSDVNIPNLDIQLDDTQITGSLKAETPGQSPVEPTSLAGRLQIDRLDIDRYMPKPSGEAQPASGEPGDSKAPADPESMPAVDLVVSMGTLKVGGATMPNVTMTVKGGQGQYRVNPIRADLYGGSLDADASFDLTGQVPGTRLTSSLDGINLGALLTDVTGDAPVRGTLRTAFSISAAGADAQQLMRTLGGSGNFQVANGDFPVASDLPQLVEIDQTGALNQVKNAVSQTSFSELKGSFRIKNGVVTNNDLFLAMQMVEVEGRGAVNLPAQEIDYLATMDLLSASVLPIRIRGPLRDPSIFVDPVELVRLSAQGVQTLVTAPMDAVKAFVNGTIPGSEALGDEGEGVGEAGRRVLEGLLGGGQSDGQPQDQGSPQQGQDSGKAIQEGIGNALDSIFGGSK
ncbi:MAG: AsmA family protein [Oceanidesulfovibrio sp.]